MENNKKTDPGFGRNYNPNLKRLINKDGSYNVIKSGKIDGIRDIYLYLLNINWMLFSCIIISYFVIANLLFALLYFILGDIGLNFNWTSSPLHNFSQCFFFSTQTFTTVGYGLISPIHYSSSIIASTEALFGLLSFSIATGLMYGRFSKPNAKIIFSKNALISPYKENKTALMFRLVNQRKSDLSNVEAKVIVSMFEKDQNTQQYKRTFYSLDLEIESIRFFPSTWTIVHEITPESPLFKFANKCTNETKIEISIFIEGFDENFSQTVHIRHSYLQHEIIEDAKFRPSYYIDEDGYTNIDISKLGDYDKA